MARPTYPPLPNNLPAKTAFLGRRSTTPMSSRPYLINTNISPLPRFSTLNLALPHLYRNVDSSEFRKWMYNQIVELHRYPEALAKLPPHARKDQVLTDFLPINFGVQKIEEMIVEVIRLYESLVTKSGLGLVEI
jgi:hypothetical protein